MTTNLKLDGSPESVVSYVLQIAGFGSAFNSAIRDHGAVFTSQPLPAEFERGPKKQCFMNAGRLALERDDLFYCEGVAHSVIPVEHAWCIDREGRVIDPTWDEPERCTYVGVAFKPDWFFDRIQKTGMWGVIGGEMFPKDLRFTLHEGLLDLTTLGLSKGLSKPESPRAPQPASGRGPGL